MTSFLASFIRTTPSPHRRINAPGSLLAFAHIHGEAGTPTGGVWSAVVGRHGPFLCAEGVDFQCKKSITLQKLVKRFYQEKKNTTSKNSKNEWQEMLQNDEKSMPLLIVAHHD
jgi:hypothetical protein